MSHEVESAQADEHGYGDDSDCICGRNFAKVRGLREHLTKQRQAAAIDALTFASAYVGTDGSVRVHYARCEPCMYGQHDGGPHDWAGPEDVAHALVTDQPDPTGLPCACYCTSEPPRAPEEPDFESVEQDVCDLCGEVGACAYDAEGRPLIHAAEDTDD